MRPIERPQIFQRNLLYMSVKKTDIDRAGKFLRRVLCGGNGAGPFVAGNHHARHAANPAGDCARLQVGPRPVGFRRPSIGPDGIAIHRRQGWIADRSIFFVTARFFGCILGSADSQRKTASIKPAVDSITTERIGIIRRCPEPCCVNCSSARSALNRRARTLADIVTISVAGRQHVHPHLSKARISKRRAAVIANINLLGECELFQVVRTRNVLTPVFCL